MKMGLDDFRSIKKGGGEPQIKDQGGLDFMGGLKKIRGVSFSISTPLFSEKNHHGTQLKIHPLLNKK